MDRRELTGPFMGEPGDLQLGSSFFGRLPPEIREMIYNECWIASGTTQHVFSSYETHEGRRARLTHFPCCKQPGDDDEMAAQHRQVCDASRAMRTRTMVVEELWASRFSSTWGDHWRCEEEMRLDDPDLHFDSSAKIRPWTQTLFLPVLLTCKRMYVNGPR